MRVFLDANILFSAAKSDGAVRALLRLLFDGGHLCIADTYVMAEAERNLRAKAPDALPALAALAGGPVHVAAATRAADHEAAGLLPPKDRPVLGAAIALGCDVLLTGDRTHFGPLYGSRPGGVTVHSPRSLFPALTA